MLRHTKSHRFCEVAAAVAGAELEIGLDSNQT